ncbi:MAG: cobN 5 [Sporomusa sp.]|jgi:cobaltochelatase CobN|nr:cobN 5 [Sporomusa sp.]
MGRIIFLTNMERQYLMLKRAWEGVVQAGIASEARLVLLTDAVPWGVEWQKTFFSIEGELEERCDTTIS